MRQPYWWYFVFYASFSSSIICACLSVSLYVSLSLCVPCTTQTSNTQGILNDNMHFMADLYALRSSSSTLIVCVYKNLFDHSFRIIGDCILVTTTTQATDHFASVTSPTLKQSSNREREKKGRTKERNRNIDWNEYCANAKTSFTLYGPLLSNSKIVFLPFVRSQYAFTTLKLIWMMLMKCPSDDGWRNKWKALDSMCQMLPSFYCIITGWYRLCDKLNNTEQQTQKVKEERDGEKWPI